jgi:hypothetical protein
MPPDPPRKSTKAEALLRRPLPSTAAQGCLRSPRKRGEVQSPLFRVPVDDRAEQLPFLAGEFHHLDLLDRIEIRR